MTGFTNTEDFPKSEIEFEARFSKPEACFDYLYKQKWPIALCANGAVTINTGSVRRSLSGYVFLYNIAL
jgi:hypothetical protein